MKRSATLAVSQDTITAFYGIAVASFFICAAWLVQTKTFSGADTQTAVALWTLMAEGVLGVGIGAIYVARCWLKAQ